MYAVIRTGAKQYRVQPGDVLEVELLDGEKGKEIALEDVLLIADGEKIQVGKPNIKGARVTARSLRGQEGQESHRLQVPPPRRLPPQTRYSRAPLRFEDQRDHCLIFVESRERSE